MLAGHGQLAGPERAKAHTAWCGYLPGAVRRAPDGAWTAPAVRRQLTGQPNLRRRLRRSEKVPCVASLRPGHDHGPGEAYVSPESSGDQPDKTPPASDDASIQFSGEPGLFESLSQGQGYPDPGPGARGEALRWQVARGWSLRRPGALRCGALQHLASSYVSLMRLHPPEDLQKQAGVVPDNAQAGEDAFNYMQVMTTAGWAQHSTGIHARHLHLSSTWSSP